MEKRDRLLAAGFLTAAGALVFFGWLAGEVLRGETLQFDLAVRGAVHSLASPLLTRAMRGVTQLGSLTFLLMLGVVLVWQLVASGRRRAAMLFAVAVLGAEGLNEILKLVFRRARPDAFFGLAEPITYSFPSGHSVASACFYGVLAAILSARVSSPIRKAAIWTGAALLAGSIGFSRIYLGVHYPSDVLAGYTAAIIWVGAVRAGYHVWLRRAAQRMPQ